VPISSSRSIRKTSRKARLKQRSYCRATHFRRQLRAAQLPDHVDRVEDDAEWAVHRRGLHTQLREGFGFHRDGVATRASEECPTLSFLLDTTRVLTDANTIFDDLSCGDLNESRRVEVEGRTEDDGSVLAVAVSAKSDR
jgi:hypothetical protein